LNGGANNGNRKLYARAGESKSRYFSRGSRARFAAAIDGAEKKCEYLPAQKRQLQQQQHRKKAFFLAAAGAAASFVCFALLRSKRERGGGGRVVSGGALLTA